MLEMFRVLLLSSLILACGTAALAASPANCSVSGSTVPFGTYDIFALSPTDTVGTVSVSCYDPGNANVSARVEFGAGQYGYFAGRAMKWTGGAVVIGYNLFTDAARTQVWGDGSGSTVAVTIKTKVGVVTPIPIYGRMPAGQDVAAGIYADRVTVTVTP